MWKQWRDHPFSLWALLALPACGFLVAWMSRGTAAGGQPIAEALLHPTGEFSARLMILAMMIGPLRASLPAFDFLRWMRQRRRYFGVAAFAYGMLHLALYLDSIGGLHAALDEIGLPGIWTGWLALIVFIPLAVTSSDRAVRAMGRNWVLLQRLVYLAALATLAHWAIIHGNMVAALLHFVPLAAAHLWLLAKSHITRKANP